MKTKKSCFCKRKSCPATNSLLSYLNRETARAEAANIARHLAKCDFCDAELQFLNAHEQSEETFKLPEMPVQLRQLAEILLAGKQTEFAVLQQLFNRPRVAFRSSVSLSV